MQMTLIESGQSSRDFCTAYDRLASAYDEFTGGGDYAAWATGLLREVARHGVTGGRAFEIGCGTGRTTEAVVAAGFRVTACDPSPAMLARARARYGGQVAFLDGGLPDLPGPAGAAELVLALNDVLNYVPHADLPAAGAAMAARTAPGGVVLFDVNTARTYVHGFFAETFVRRAGGRLFVSEPVPVDEPGVHAADLHILTPAGDRPGLSQYEVSSHRHFHHPHVAVTAALAAAGLELLEALGQHDDGRRDPHFDEDVHTKRVYLARRP